MIGGNNKMIASMIPTSDNHLGSFVSVRSWRTSSIATAPHSVILASVAERSNFASSALITKKNLSLVARLNREIRCSGFENIGSLFKPHMPKNVANALDRTMISNVTGMFAGTLKIGLPPMK